MTGHDTSQVAVRLRAAAAGIGMAGTVVRGEAAAALGGDAWLGTAARAAHRLHWSSATVADQIAALLRRAASVLDTLVVAATAAERQRSQVIAEGARLGWRTVGDQLLPASFGSPPMLGSWLPAQLVAVQAAERAADAAAASALRKVTAELLRLRITAAHPVDVLVDPAATMLLRRAGVLNRAGGAMRSVAQVAAEIRSLLGRRDPVALRGYVDGLPEAIRKELVTENPQLIGSGDGLPPAMRYAANRQLVEQAHAQARRAGDAALASRLELWLRPGRNFLLVDLAGGRVAEVLGDLDTATHVTVLVPGMLNDPANFDPLLAADARRLHGFVSRAMPGQVATIAWLGYRTPGVVTAALDSAARAAAGALRDLIAGLVLRSGITTTVVAHSYGTLVAGRSLGEGLRVDGVVALGSPGMGAATAAGLHAPAGTRIFAARTPGDPVAWSENFGRDPTDPRFGADRMDTGDPSEGGPIGHTGYFRGDSECLRNLSRIVTGHYSDVTVVAPSRLERTAATVGEVADFSAAGPAAVRAAERAVAAVVPEPLERRASDVIEAQQRVDHLARRLRDPDLYVQIAGEAAAIRKAVRLPTHPTGWC